jgi:hypothetical protein
LFMLFIGMSLSFELQFGSRTAFILHPEWVSRAANIESYWAVLPPSTR